MPVLKYLADTNCISDFFRGAVPVRSWFASHRGEVGISSITLAEIRRGIELRPEGKSRRVLEKHCRFLVEDFRKAIFSFDEAAAVAWGRLMRECRGQPIPYDDSLIAAIALSAELTVVTRNVRHFRACSTVNPWGTPVE